MTRPKLSPLAAMITQLHEAGARNSASDQALIQQVHDTATSLGASCDTGDPGDTTGQDDAMKAESKRQAERRVFQEANLSHGDIADALRSALQAKYPGNAYAWVKDVYDDSVIYELEGNPDVTAIYQASYSILDGVVTLGDPKKVTIVTTYQPVGESRRGMSEAVDLHTDLIVLEEKAVRKDGTISLKVINAGWGSSGYYGADVLKRDGPTAFPNGTHMYVDHPTVQEDAMRPERSVKDLAAQLTGDAHWDESGAKGPGLYADATVFGAWKDTLNEMAPAIGVSIRASGLAKNGTAEGKSGKIIESITQGRSVDFVTVPGRGGEILSLYESARGRASEPGPAQKGPDMDLQEAQTKLAESERKLAESATRLVAAEARAAQLAEGAILRDAREFSACRARLDRPARDQSGAHRRVARHESDRQGWHPRRDRVHGQNQGDRDSRTQVPRSRDRPRLRARHGRLARRAR